MERKLGGEISRDGFVDVSVEVGRLPLELKVGHKTNDTAKQEET